MMEVQSYIVLLLAQVTVIGVVALSMSHLAGKSPASRHTIALTGLILILLSPLATWLLPLRWHALVSNPNPTQLVSDQRAFLQQEEVPLSNFESLSEVVDDSPAQPWLSSHNQVDSIAVEVPTVDVAAQRDVTSGDDVAIAAPSGTTTKPSNWIRTALFALLSIWCAGAIVCAARLLIRLRRFYSLVLPLNPLPQEALPAKVRQSLQKVLGTNELPVISTSSTVPSPVVIGVLSPIVVLPEAIINDLSEEELTSVLIHECAHVVRRDPWFHLAQQFAGIVWWFHPVVNKLNHVLSRSREEICDNYVLRHAEPAEFSRTLLKLAERSQAVRPALSLLGMFGNVWSLETRVQGLLAPQRSVFVKSDFRWTAVIVVVLSACCLMVGGRSAVLTMAPQSVSEQNNSGIQQQNTSKENTQAAETKPATQQGETIKVSLSGVYHLPESNDGVSAKVQVYHFRLEGPMLLGEMRTNDKGEFEFDELEVEKCYEYENVIVLATAPGFVSSALSFHCPNEENSFKLKLPMSNNPITISGTVTDEDGAPLVGANVFFGYPILGFQSDVTDSSGRFKIRDLPATLSEFLIDDLVPVRPPARRLIRSTGFSVMVQHPDYPNFRAEYTEPREVLDIQLPPPAVIEGRVFDLITGAPVPNVAVHAQGVADSYWVEVLTDVKGRFHLRLQHDHYNIWAVQKGRMPLAIKAIEAVPGVRSVGHEIRMVRGGFINGRVLSKDGKPITKGLVGHHGPARPATGAAVTSTKVNGDGTFRLQVAPGRNYVYFMSDQSANAYVEVGEEQEVDVELVVDDGSEQKFAMDPDRMLRSKLLADKYSKQPPMKFRIRRNTSTNRLLDKLEDMNQTNELRLSEPWAELLREIVEGGPKVVPELIEELDATDNQAMLRCLGFVLRAIGDKRAVPALIRAIPKTLQPGASDYGVSIENDDELLRFMQKYDLDEEDWGNDYGFGRPVREIFGALKSLTGQKFNEQQLYHIIRSGLPSQIYAKEKLFYKTASQWRDWWEQTGAAMVDEPKYKKVGLVPLPESKPAQLDFDVALKQVDGSAGNNLGPIRMTQEKCWGSFYDLDTGRYAALPKKWKQETLTDDDMKAILNWATDEGFDLMGDEYQDNDGNKTYALRTIGLQDWQLRDKYWKWTTSSFTVDSLKSEGSLVPDQWLLFRDRETRIVSPAKPASFLFITREGTPGLIYVGVPVTKKYERNPNSKITTILGDADPDLRSTGFSLGRRFGIGILLPK